MVNFQQLILLTLLVFISFNSFSSDTVKISNGSTTYFKLKSDAIKGVTAVSGSPTAYKSSVAPLKIVQGFKGGLEIPAVKVKIPFTAKLGWNKSTLQKAVKLGISGGKFSGVGVFLSVGLEQALEANGFFVEKGRLVVVTPPNVDSIVPISGGFSISSVVNSARFSSAYEGCTYLDRGSWSSKGYTLKPRQFSKNTTACEFFNNFGDRRTVGWIVRRVSCPTNTLSHPLGCVKKEKNFRNVTDNDLKKLNLDNYNFTKKDAENLSKYLGEPSAIIFDDIKSFKLTPETITKTLSDGTTTTQRVNTEIDVVFNNKKDNLSAKITTRKTTTDYENGTQVSSSTETSVSDSSLASTVYKTDDTTTSSANTSDIQFPECQKNPTLEKCLTDYQKELNKISKSDKKVDISEEESELKNALKTEEIKISSFDTRGKNFTRECPEISIDFGEMGIIDIPLSQFCNFLAIVGKILIAFNLLGASYFILRDF